MHIRYTIHIVDLHREAEIESVDQVIAELFDNEYRHEHDNLLIPYNTDNYNIEEFLLKFDVAYRSISSPLILMNEKYKI